MVKVTIDSTTGLVRVDGIPLCQRVKTRDGVKLVVMDKANCKRTRLRNRRAVEITLQEFVQAVTGLSKPEDVI